jgi:hypothetical protein
MALATWWCVDGIPQMAPQTGVSVEVAVDDDLLASIAHVSRGEIAKRRTHDHRPLGYGWVALRQASIGELDLDIELTGHRYLWDFATLPAFRRRSVYPNSSRRSSVANARQRDFGSFTPKRTFPPASESGAPASHRSPSSRSTPMARRRLAWSAITNVLRFEPFGNNPAGSGHLCPRAWTVHDPAFDPRI